MNKNYIDLAKSIFRQRQTEKARLRDQYIDYLCHDEVFHRLLTELNVARLRVYQSGEADRLSYQSALDTAQKNLDDYITQHDIDRSILYPTPDCDKCNDTGVVDSKYCECFVRELSRVKLSKLKNNFAKFSENDEKYYKNNEKTLKNYKIIKNWCENYGNNAIRNINLIGYTAVGKTYMLECVATYLLDKGVDVVFVTAFDFNNECKKYTFGQPSKMDEYLSAEVLIIDDLGTEPNFKNITNDCLLNVLNTRLNNNLSTLTSTNLTLDGVLQRYGERTFSRLLNKRVSYNLLFEGQDARIKN